MPRYACFFLEIRLKPFQDALERALVQPILLTQSWTSYFRHNLAPQPVLLPRTHRKQHLGTLIHGGLWEIRANSFQNF